MKRSILILLTVAPLLGYAQNKKIKSTGYATLKGGGIAFKHANVIGTGSLSGGINMSGGFAVGAGMGVMKFQDMNNAYIPIYLEFSHLKFEKKVAPYLNLQLGRGIYHEQIASVNTKAGFYFSGGAGISLGVGKRQALLIHFNYVNESLQSDTYFGGSRKKENYSLEGFSFGIGLAFR